MAASPLKSTRPGGQPESRLTPPAPSCTFLKCYQVSHSSLALWYFLHMEIGDQRFCKILHSFPHSQTMGKCVGQMVARIFSYPSYIPNFSTLGWSLTPWIKLWEPYWSHKAAPSSSTEAATVRGLLDTDNISAKPEYIAPWLIYRIVWSDKKYLVNQKDSACQPILSWLWLWQGLTNGVQNPKWCSRTVWVKASPLRLKLSCRPIGWNSQTEILYATVVAYISRHVHSSV